MAIETNIRDRDVIRRTPNVDPNSTLGKVMAEAGRRKVERARNRAALGLPPESADLPPVPKVHEIPAGKGVKEHRDERGRVVVSKGLATVTYYHSGELWTAVHRSSTGDWIRGHELKSEAGIRRWAYGRFGETPPPKLKAGKVGGPHAHKLVPRGG
ncbi:hypothetical protein [Alienimonas sp. DA493]|uniref:hypothetical protein n=1 Tax=Alienimonas sp. DA493 TaxID=3373605 RepID=UPI003754622E